MLDLDLNDTTLDTAAVATDALDFELPDLISADGVAYRWCPHLKDWQCLGFAE